MNFSAHETEQNAAILTRYPHFSPPDLDVDEWDNQFYQSRRTYSLAFRSSNNLVKWEKSMLRKKRNVIQDGVIYFMPALVTVQPSNGLRPRAGSKVNETMCVYSHILWHIFTNLA